MVDTGQTLIIAAQHQREQSSQTEQDDKVPRDGAHVGHVQRAERYSHTNTTARAQSPTQLHAQFEHSSGAEDELLT